MKESGFSIFHQASNVRVKGGELWNAPERKAQPPAQIVESSKTLRIALQPQDSFEDISDALYECVRQKAGWRYVFFALNKRLPSLLLIVPVTVTILFIGFITVFGDLFIDWVFMNPDEGTVFGINRRWSLIIYGLISIMVLYLSPAIFSGEQESFVEAVNRRFSSRNVLRNRYRKLANFLSKNAGIQQVEIWNPNLLDDKHDWIKKSLIPAMIDAATGVTIHVSIDERNLAENYLQRVLKYKEMDWLEEEVEETTETSPIAYNYLDSWERKMLTIYVFASTANMPAHWQLEGTEQDGVLPAAVSLRLVEEIVERFKERLFDEEERAYLISIDAFASRCLNDYGILRPILRYTNDVWDIDATVVERELRKAQEELRYIRSYLQIDIEYLSERLEDPAAALLLSSVHTKASIYNHDRLEATRFFVRIIRKSEQYKIVKQYWKLITQSAEGADNMSEDIYRILGVQLLIELADIFEKAALYEEAWDALEYIETVFPYKGKMGKARVMERRGKFDKSVAAMLELYADWQADRIRLQPYSQVDFCLNFAWAVVSGRLEAHRPKGEELLEKARELLYAEFDQIRNSEQIIRMHNIKANYQEWNKQPEGSIESYDKALRIPGVNQSSLSNLLVNKGIALRQMGRLQEACTFGAQGVSIKAAIGDADQLPIAQHNLAQSYVELGYQSQDPQEQLHCWQEAERHAADGLSILADTGSVKKKGQLLCEYFIGRYEQAKAQGQSTEESLADLKAVHDWLQAEAEAGRGESYDCTVVRTELLGIMPDGDSLLAAKSPKVH